MIFRIACLFAFASACVQPPIVTKLEEHEVIRTFALSVHTTGHGTITSDDGVINCGATCSAERDEGTLVTLTATAAADSTFTGWTGACSGVDTCVLTMSEARDATATFTLRRATITVERAGSGGGKITSSPAGLDCGATCTLTLDFGTALTLTATPSIGSAFDGFTGACGGATCALVIDADATITATFNPPQTTRPELGFDGEIFAVLPTNDGSGDVYVGGYFVNYRGVFAPHVIRLNADGTKDASFNVGTGFDGPVHALALADDGDLYVGGGFANYNGTNAANIIRLNPSGTVDATFATGTGFDNALDVIAPASDGSGDVYVGGSFTTYDGTASRGLIRLDSDGGIDAGFSVGQGVGGEVTSIALVGDGDLYIGGSFGSYDNVAASGVLRLDSTGARDTGFATGSGTAGFVFALARTSDGDLYVAGNITSYDGTPAPQIIRLNDDGTVDAGFNPGTGFDSRVRALAIDGTNVIAGGRFTSYNGTPARGGVRLTSSGAVAAGLGAFQNEVITIARNGDGDLYFGGNFFSYAGTASHGLVRTNADGSADTTFAVGGARFSDEVHALLALDADHLLVAGHFQAYDAIEPNRLVRLDAIGGVDGVPAGTGFQQRVSTLARAHDGKLYAGGDFAEYAGVARSRLARLNADLSLDATFNIGGGFNGRVTSIAPLSDGRVYAAGFFTTFDGNAQGRIVRLAANGALDTTFTTGAGFDNSVLTVALAADGSGDLYVGGNFTSYDGTPSARVIRLNENGSIDAAFAIGTGFSGGSVNALLPLSDGDLYVGGNFTDYNGAPVNRFARLNADGTLDAGFVIGAGFNGQVSVILASPEHLGDVYVAGNFQTYNGVAAIRVIRLNADGTQDTLFNATSGFDSLVNALIPAGDGSGDLYAGGQFAHYRGAPASRFQRITAFGLAR